MPSTFRSSVSSPHSPCNIRYQDMADRCSSRAAGALEFSPPHEVLAPRKIQKLPVSVGVLCSGHIIDRERADRSSWICKMDRSRRQTGGTQHPLLPHHTHGPIQYGYIYPLDSCLKSYIRFFVSSLLNLKIIILEGKGWRVRGGQGGIMPPRTNSNISTISICSTARAVTVVRPRM